MTTNFTALPIVDLAPLSSPNPDPKDVQALADQLHEVFKTVGFAYLINAPISFSHQDVFGTAKEFFSIPHKEKMKLAKRTFRGENVNTYRGFFPAQTGSDNLKEGFEVGPSSPRTPSQQSAPASPFILTEGNVWPSKATFTKQALTEQLYTELQSLSTTLLAMLATSLGKDLDCFTSLLTESISTLRYLHYPAITPPAPHQELNCTPHTDSGLLTLLHQDSTGGLEVLNAAGEWIPAPYVPNSIVVNIGDLMAQMSGGRYVATYHRVKSSGAERYSVPFFCEPGVDAMVGEEGNQVPYRQFVLGKMGTWVEFQGVEDHEPPLAHAPGHTAVEAY
ncbi:hypothetical protein FH972_025952 [Carpinus fangiana]|uniref:Fe2OG dioxygenase domain-containing protein n=1 Tax=Carpinus fangiana TaxID=176857 RepID=A0A5N6L2S0_9ROSI|nr:hypothetical protein FH972_025952 [Carpinus fangiana]